MENNGERQVSPDLGGIRRDHVARYEFAAKVLQKGIVLDVACGIGYGSAILHDAGHKVLGIDKSEEAIAFGRKHYRRKGVKLQAGDANRLKVGAHAAAVCFETIEHLEDPAPLLKALRKAAPLLIASVPNESVFPWRGHKFHFRHYTRRQFEALLAEAGWEVTAWYGQRGPDSEVEPNIEGRTLVAVARRATPRKVPKAPEHVAIVGLGPSCASFFELVRRLGGISAYCDEVWGLNAMGDVLRCDRIFHMDDLQVQEARAAARPDSNIAAMVKWLKKHPGPIYTSIPREGYPGLVPFPLQEVLNARYDGEGQPYFNSTAAYAVVYAIHEQVKRLSLFGMDYTLENAHQAEKGRACVEFWLGIAAARGIEITVPDTTSLLDGCEPDGMRLYGYDCVDVAVRDGDGGLEVSFKDRETPSAAEIEKRYDHKRHPNPLVKT